MTATLVIGGARSGKTRYAEQLALSLSPKPVYLATSRIWDENHARRIQAHRDGRGPEWRTIEQDRRLSAPALERDVVVVDCVTLWLTNLFFDLETDVERCLTEARSELERTLGRDNTWIFVTSEIGQGLHAPTDVGRRFTDLQGLVNQHLAARAQGVAWLVAGIPHYVKGTPPTHVL